MSTTPTGSNPEPDDARPPEPEELREALVGEEPDPPAPDPDSPDATLSPSDAEHFAEDHLTLDSGVAEAARAEAVTAGPFEVVDSVPARNPGARVARSKYGALYERLAERGGETVVVGRAPRGTPEAAVLFRTYAGLKRLGVEVSYRTTEGGIVILYATVAAR